MANYYWVGANGNVGISRYDFNAIANWQTSYWNSQATGASFGWSFRSATAAPGIGDRVWVGASDMPTVPQSLSPILYGGYSGNSAYGEWSHGIGSTGTTTNSSLISININANTSKYPYEYFGGGLTSTIYDWAVNVDGLSADAFVGSTGARAILPLKLKVAQTYSLQARSSASIDITNVKSPSSPYGLTSSIVTTSMYIDGAGYIKVRGGSISNIQNVSSGSLYLENIICGSLLTVPSSVYTETNTKFGNVYIGEGQYKAPMWFGGSLDTPLVLADLGFTGGTTGSNAASNDSGLIVSPVAGWWNGGGLTTNPVLYFGLPGTTSNVSYCKKIQIESSPGTLGLTGAAAVARWNLAFAGGASAASIEVSDTTVRVFENIDPSVAVKIGTLGMSRKSILNFAHEAPFDNWFFGSISGSSIEGGILFRDETPSIMGSAGVRLFNTQIILNNRSDARTGRTTNTSATLPQTAD